MTMPTSCRRFCFGAAYDQEEWVVLRQGVWLSSIPQFPKLAVLMYSSSLQFCSGALIYMQATDGSSCTHPSEATRLCSVTIALGFFSTAYTRTRRPVSAAAASEARTSGPRPAPTTCGAWPWRLVNPRTRVVEQRLQSGLGSWV